MKRCPLLIGLASLFVSLASAAEWRTLPLIKGGQLAPEWKQAGWGRMLVEGDAIRTECSEKGLGLLVYTKEKFGDCQIRVVYRPENAKSNSGVHIRMDEGILKWIGCDAIAVKREPNGKLSKEMLAKMEDASNHENGAWYAVHHGFEVQIQDDADAFHRTGSIYSYASATVLPAIAASGWRTMIITLQGEIVTIELDGKQIARFDAAAKDIPPRKRWSEPKRDTPRPTHGYIGLQTHDPGDVVWFKEVSVRALTN